MRIVDNRLFGSDESGVPFVASPNKGARVKHKYVVVHYTAMPDVRAAIRQLTDSASGVSAHAVVSRDGRVTQLVGFDEVAFHAGQSNWKGDEDLNKCSIGIELDNAGRLERVDGRWRAWFGGQSSEADVVEATHKNGTQPSGWHVYTPAQIDATLQLVRVLVKEFDLADIIGHDDISPGRKWDPGPAFPIERFRSQVFGI